MIDCYKLIIHALNKKVNNVLKFMDLRFGGQAKAGVNHQAAQTHHTIKTHGPMYSVSQDTYASANSLLLNIILPL